MFYYLFNHLVQILCFPKIIHWRFEVLKYFVRFYIGWSGERNNFIRVWKPLRDICILKALRERGKTKKRQYLLAVGLGCYKWYQVRHWTMCQRGDCSSKGVDTKWCASKDAGPRKGVNLVGVSHRLEKDAEP